jgi:hypothetical protein
MKQIIYLALLTFLFLPHNIDAQRSFSGKFKKKAYTHYGHSYTLYDFSREGTVMRAKYFASNAYQQYLNWKSGKDILLVTAGAFSDSWAKDGKPVGLCVDNGRIVTRDIDGTMDGMVIVYNGAAQVGGIAIVDLDKKPVTVENPYGSGNYETYYPRSYSSHRTSFLNWGDDAGVTLFQSQLVYSKDKSSNFDNLYYGKKRERRFLAICKKNGVVHHVIVDAPDPLYLNQSAQYAKAVLDYDGFDVLFIVNLDTGGKNILHAHDGYYLRNLNPNPDATIDEATNLIVYYME